MEMVKKAYSHITIKGFDISTLEYLLLGLVQNQNVVTLDTIQSRFEKYRNRNIQLENIAETSQFEAQSEQESRGEIFEQRREEEEPNIEQIEYLEPRDSADEGVIEPEEIAE